MNSKLGIAEQERECKMRWMLQTLDGRYYNGKAGNWSHNLTVDKAEAFKYGFDYAMAKAEQFNSFNNIHGLTFIVVEA